MVRKFVWLAVLLFSLGAQGADIYKWVDAQGQTHYGNEASAKRQKNAKPAQRDSNEAARDHKHASPKHKKPPPTVLPIQDSPVSAAQTANKKELPCETALRLYQESEACFAPYRNATGGLKAEAFQHCTEVKQPPPC